MSFKTELFAKSQRAWPGEAQLTQYKAWLVQYLYIMY